MLECVGENNVFENKVSIRTILLIVGSCLFAILANISTFSLAGKSSSTTHQVIDHLKGVILLIFGYTFFPSTWPNTWRTIRAIIGIIIAFCGVFWYSFIKNSSKLPAEKGEPNIEQHVSNYQLSDSSEAKEVVSAIPSSELPLEEDVDRPDSKGSISYYLRLLFRFE
jgi:cytochrome c biogenesis protein CcdA